MILRALLVLAFAIFGLTQNQVAVAQGSGEGLGDPELKWCVTLRGADGEQCGLSSPGAVCNAAMQSFYPQDGNILRNVRVSESGLSVTCQTDPVPIREDGRLWIGDPGGSQKCENGLLSGGQCSSRPQVSSQCPTGNTPVHEGNPIDLLSGIKFQNFQDFATADGRLAFGRSYASRSYGTLNDNSTDVMGRAWSVDNLPRLVNTRIGVHVLYLPGHQAVQIQCSPSSCKTLRNEVYGGGRQRAQIDLNDDRFIPDLGQAQNTIPIIDEGNIKYIFKSQEVGGRMIFGMRRVEYPTGYAIDYESRLLVESFGDGSYVAGPVRFLIEKMTDSFGREITLEYDTEGGTMTSIGDAQVSVPEKVGLLTKVTFPDESVLNFGYEVVTSYPNSWYVPRRLVSAARQSAAGEVIKSEIYHYEDSRFPFALTGITDTAEIRYATWAYDARGFAISSEHAGGVDKYEFDYDIDLTGSSFVGPTVTETNPLGRNTIYKSESFGSYFKEIDGIATSSCVGDARLINNTPSSSDIIDREGRRTKTTKNDYGWETSRTEAFGTDEQRVISTKWHPDFRLPVQRIMPDLTLDVVYDDAGRMTALTQTDTSANPSSPRIWAFTYDGPNLVSVDGPLQGSGDTQSFTYEGPNLTSFTNEVGQTTQITAHNPIGAPAVFTDSNGITTRLIYDADNMLTDIIEDDGGVNATTSILYSDTDQILSVTPPNGATLTFTYDDARRLKTITNAAGETITYTRNNMGGVEDTQMSDDSGAVSYQLAQVFDHRNRVKLAIGAGATASGLNAETEFGYDREDNLTSIIDPRQKTWTQSFDALDRLESETDPLLATTEYGLSKQTALQNPLTSVTDARGATTNYVRNGFGEIIREISFEAGTTNYVRDTRGLITQMTDARGVVSHYAYDDMGRLLSVSYPSASESNITYTYDEGPNGKGQLTSVTEDYGVTDYSYNTLGHMTAMRRTINGQSYAAEYSYDLAGEVLTTSYPSGRVVTYIRDAAARVTDVTLSGDVNANILSDVTYLPFGPMTGARFGDGHDLSLTYDSSYRATTLKRQMISTSIMDIDFEYDAAGDILALNDNLDNDRSQRFEYSDVSRLTRAEGVYGDIDYSYNLVGDRVARTRQRVSEDGALELITEDYSYDPATFQLTEVSVGAAVERAFDYAPSGQITRDDRTGQVGGVGAGADFTFENDARGRLARVFENGSLVASYLYDDYEQRIAKTTAAGTVHYHYDLEGRLISETNGEAGEIIREYLWLGLAPIAVISAGERGLPEGCDPDELENIEGLLSARENTLATIRAQVDVLMQTRETRVNTLGTVTARRTRLQGILDGVNPSDTDRIADLTSRIANDDVRIAELNANIESLDERLAYYAERDEYLSGRVTALTRRVELLEQACAGANDNSPSAALYYLHTDHLGRPNVATNTSGEIVWDGGMTTPFGQGVTTMGAITQKLMFPGQYEDTETGYAHNWHRTYDPTLGRYLQADPIGLAGGLNRYAYVGGNPVSSVDPTGEIVPILVVGGAFLAGAALDAGLQYLGNGKRIDCINWWKAGGSGLLSTVPVGRAVYALGAKAISRSGLGASAAHAARQSLKNKWRFGFFPDKAPFIPGTHTVASAGRTNLRVNTIAIGGGGLAASVNIGRSTDSDDCSC